MKKIKIGLIGFGTIGSGVVKVLLSKRSLLRAKTGIDLSLSMICDKDLGSKRPVKVSRKMLTRSVGRILVAKGHLQGLRGLNVLGLTRVKSESYPDPQDLSTLPILDQ